MTSDLARLSEAAILLADAETLPQIRNVLNVADRLRDYAKAARLGLDAQNSAAAIAIEAEAKAGELLIQQAAAGQRRQPGQSLPSMPLTGRAAEPPATLAELGVTRNESATWQAVAAIPAEDRIAYVAEAREREQEITRAGLMRHAAPVAKAELGRALASRDAAYDRNFPGWRDERAAEHAVNEWDESWSLILREIRRRKPADVGAALDQDALFALDLHIAEVDAFLQQCRRLLSGAGLHVVNGGAS